MNWLRVSKQRRCEICHRPDWCLITPSGALCMRVVSNKPITLKDGSVGYIHDGQGAVPLVKEKPKPEPVINSSKLLCEWRESNQSKPVTILADKLGVAASALLSLGATWASPHRAWAFGMKDGWGNLIGIRLRSDDGHKWAVRGSHSGIFLPNVAPERTALICEGPTNCAAGVHLGYFTIGIPSAGAGVPHLCAAIKRLGVRRVALICDNKDGDISFRSNPTIQNHLPVPSCLLVLPCKDLRDFVQMGGTSGLLESIMQSTVWKHL